MVDAFSPNLLLLEYGYEKQAGWNWDIKIDQKFKKKEKECGSSGLSQWPHSQKVVKSKEFMQMKIKPSTVYL